MDSKTDQERIEEAMAEYKDLCHAMQSGVSVEIAQGISNAHSPKHLRVGVNSAMSDVSALADLMIKKGLFTKAEYIEAVRDAMKREVADYEDRISAATGTRVTLG